MDGIGGSDLYAFSSIIRMMKDQHVKVSRLLSFILRHQPDAIGLRVDEKGWASVEELIVKFPPQLQLTRTLLQQVVTQNDKKRFAFSPDGSGIRANQGHSFQGVRLDAPEMRPPSILYHGTARRFLDSVMATGLSPQKRQHVHLSVDAGTAFVVGRRHGAPVVLQVDTYHMVLDGHRFYLSENNVWLTNDVLPTYLTVDMTATAAMTSRAPKLSK